MGARRIDSRRRSALLSVEPLEDRLLLSGAGTFVADSVSALPAHLPITSQQSTQPQTPVSNGPTAKGTTSWGTAITRSQPLATAGPSRENESRPPPSTGGERAAAGLPAVAPQYLSSPAIGPTLYRPDRDGDDDSPAKEMEEALLRSTQGSSVVYPFTNEEAIGPNYGTPSTTPEQIPAKDGEPHLFLNLLSAAGLGSAVTSGVAVASPFAAPGNAGKDHGKSAREEEGETTPGVPKPPPLVLPPPAGEKDSPPPASSPGGPFADLLPIDVEAIQRSADAFFEQLGRLSEEWHDSGVIEKLTPWLVAASIVAYKWGRWRGKQSLSAPGSEDGWESVPAAFLAGDEG
jgi:hypothetical protein